MTWDEMGRIACDAWFKELDASKHFEWEDMSQEGKDAWIATAKAVYSAAAGDLAERIGQEGL